MKNVKQLILRKFISNIADAQIFDITVKGCLEFMAVIGLSNIIHEGESLE